MSTAPAGTTGPRTRPSAALVRAVLVSTPVLAVAVIAGQPALIPAVLPLLLWAVIALARRTLRGEERAVPAPQQQANRRTLEEGGTVALTVRTAPGLLTVCSVPRPPSADLAPPRGSLAADGQVRLRMTTHRWGTTRLGPTHLLVADALGAWRAQRTLPPVDVKVVPASSVLEGPVEVPAPIGVSGAHLSRRRGDGTALSEVRRFRPGDRLHRINWRVTSRTGTLHTNATFTEQDTEVLIVTDTTLDLAPAGWTPPGTPTSLDMTIRATTAIARHHLGVGDRVELFDLGHLIGPVPAGTGPRQLRVLTDALARATRDEGQHRRSRRLRSVRSGTLTVVCSPLLTEETITQIGRLVALGAEVIVVDTLPPSVGDVSVLDGAPPRVDGGYSDRFWPEAWALRRLLRERTVRELREAGVPVTPWEGPSSLGPVLMSLAAAQSAPRMRRS